MGLGQIIRHARTGLNMSQKQLANEVGCAEITIRQYEADRREPSYEMYLKLEDALGISLIAHSSDLLDRYGPAENYCPSFGDVHAQYASMKKRRETEVNTDNGVRLLNAFIKLNDNGQKKAVDFVEVLAGNSDFCKKANPPEPKE